VNEANREVEVVARLAVAEHEEMVIEDNARDDDNSTFSFVST